MAKRFVKYAGTKEQFAAARDSSNVLLSTKYEKSIVLIAGGNGGVPCIYTRGKYINDAEEFLRSIPYVKGVTDANGETVVTGGSAAVIPFKTGAKKGLGANKGTTNEALKTQLTEVTVDQNGVQITLTDGFVDFVNTLYSDLSTAKTDLGNKTGTGTTGTDAFSKIRGLRSDLGNKKDTPDASGSAFAQIAKLAADVAALGGDSGPIAQQIEAAITAALGSGGDIAMEIENQLDGLESSLMGAGLNGQTDGKVKSAIDAAINKLDGTPEGGTKVKVKVTQADGKVTGVTVDESGLTTALSGKADLSNGKITASQLPDYILGQVLYGGTVNATGVATLTDDFKSKYNVTATTITLSTSNAATYEGAYFIASANGTSGVPQTLGVVTGDWIISNGNAWTKIDNTDAVTSVVGQTGAVTAQQIANALTSGNHIADKTDTMLKSTFTTGDDDYVLLTYNKDDNELVVGASAELVDAIGKAKSAYQKPSTNIPKTDLAADVQTSLGKADAAAPQSTTYTKTEVDGKFADLEAADISIVDGSAKFPNISNVEDALTYLAEMWDWEDISAS